MANSNNSLLARSLRCSSKCSLVLFPLAAALAGCTSSPSHFYNLASTAAPAAAPAATYSVGVGSVTIPAQVDRQQFTVQAAPNRVEIDEFSRWAAPLDEGIARAVVGDLSSQLGTPRVARLPLANFDPAYRVTIDVQRFEAILGNATEPQGVLVEAIWVVRNDAGGKTTSGRTTAREQTQGTGYDAFPAAYSQALAKVSADIATAIRAQEVGRDPSTAK